MPHADETFDAERSGHPLVGRLLVEGKPYRKEFLAGECVVPPAMLLRSLVADQRPDLLLLGEVHDNPQHHAYRSLWLSLAWPSRGHGTRRAPASAVFEHIRADQQGALDRFAGFEREHGRAPTSGDLLGLLDWDSSGWPNRKLFEPLFSAVIAARLPMLPGEPARGMVREVARGGLGAVPPAERARMKLDTFLPGPLADMLAAELKGSHCGILPESAIPSLALAQRYRDSHLADALQRAAETHGSAILFAGNGHIRTDRGVPWHIRQRAPEKKVVSVMLIEVEDGKSDPETYVPRDPEGRPAADYILFTPRAPGGPTRAKACAGRTGSGDGCHLPWSPCCPLPFMLLKKLRPYPLLPLTPTLSPSQGQSDGRGARVAPSRLLLAAVRSRLRHHDLLQPLDPQHAARHQCGEGQERAQRQRRDAGDGLAHGAAQCQDAADAHQHRAVQAAPRVGEIGEGLQPELPR
jgi:uncharacterized iron-regulated protein